MATAQITSKPQRRWRQFGLRTLGLLVLLVAVGMALWRTLLAEHFLVKWIERQKGTATTEPALPDWLAWLPGSERCVHIWQINLYDCRVGDDDLWRFEGLKLLELHLLKSDVTLPAVEALVDNNPDLVCDLAFAESLYRRGMRCTIGPIEDTLQCFAIAAEYKYTVARFKSSSAYYQQAALEQHLDRLTRFADSMNRHPFAFSALDEELIACELLSVRARLAKFTNDDRKLRAVAREASGVVTQLEVLTEYQADLTLPRVLYQVLAIRRAANLRMLTECPDGDVTSRHKIVAWELDRLERLGKGLGLADGLPSSLHGSQTHLVLQLLRWQCQLQLASWHANPKVPTLDLGEVASLAAETRRAIDLEQAPQRRSMGAWIACERIVRDTEVELARFAHSDADEQAAIERHRQRIDEGSRLFFQSFLSYRNAVFCQRFVAFWWCLGVTEHLEDEGRPFFEQGFRAYLKKQLP
jgi:hypothetical protein